MSDALPTNNFVARGGAWVIIQFVLMTAVIVLGVVFHGDWTRLSVIVTGALLFVLGGGFGIAGVAVLGRNRTPYPQPRAGSELVQHGIYARVRHPLYTSVMLASLGWALIWQSGPAFGQGPPRGAVVECSVPRLSGLCAARAALPAAPGVNGEFGL
jgi:protein-S-isoprenylcysteine O-methyltransferase Ste14